MRRLIAVAAAALLLFPAGIGMAAQTEYHLETAVARADPRLYMLNDTEANYLSDDNDSGRKDIRLGTGYIISASIDFEFVHNGFNLSEDLNFTPGGVAAFSIWLKGSRDARGMRLGAEVGAGNGTVSCGRSDVIINLGTAAEPFDLPVTLNSSQLKKEQNLRVTVYVDYIGLPIGMPLALDLVTGGNTTCVVLPVENFARLVMDLSVDAKRGRVGFSAQAKGPLFWGIRMGGYNDSITGPTTPKTLYYASVAGAVVGYWEYARDGAKGGRYTFKASHTIFTGMVLEDRINFELPARDDGLGGGTVWFLLALIVIIIVLPAIWFILRRRARKR